MKRLFALFLTILLCSGTLSNVYADQYNDADRFQKMEMLISYMMSDDDPTDGSQWNTESPNSFKWSYINGCMVSAMMALYETTGQEKYYNFADTYMSPFITTSYSSSAGYIAADNFKYANYTLDDLNNGKALIDLIKSGSPNSSKYKTALQSTLYNDILMYMLDGKNGLTTAEGNLWHKKVYPYQVWLDGIYMETPFWLQYELTIAQNSDSFKIAADNVTTQIQNIYDKLRNPDTGLYYHGYDAQANSTSGNYAPSSAMDWAKEDSGTSSNYWLRGIGWFAMALVDNIELMQKAESSFDADYSANISALTKIYNELMTSMLQYQDNDTKLWYQVIDKPSGEYNYLETSGSAAMSYAFLKGYNIGIADESFYNIGLDIFRGLCDNKLIYISNGTSVDLIDICGVAGLAGPNSGATSSSAKRAYKYNKRDGSYEYYVSENTVDNDAKGAAPLIFAYCEILKSGNYTPPSQVGNSINLGGENAVYTLLPTDFSTGTKTTNSTSGIFTVTANTDKSVTISDNYIDLAGSGSNTYRSIAFNLSDEATVDIYYYNQGSDDRNLLLCNDSDTLFSMTATAGGSVSSPLHSTCSINKDNTGDIYIYSAGKGIRITKIEVTYDNAVTGIIGDVDTNSTIDKKDAAILLKHISGIASITDNDKLKLADCNQDGSCNLTDVTAIMQYITENNL